MEKFIDNLSGMPDNILYDEEGHYWIALATVIQFSPQSTSPNRSFLLYDNFKIIGPLDRGLKVFGTWHSSILQFEKLWQSWRGTLEGHISRKMVGFWQSIQKENWLPTIMILNCQWCQVGSRLASIYIVVPLSNRTLSALILINMLPVPSHKQANLVIIARCTNFCNKVQWIIQYMQLPKKL